MGRPGDDVVLQALVEIDESLGKAPHADDQIGVLLGMLLGALHLLDVVDGQVDDHQAEVEGGLGEAADGGDGLVAALQRVQSLPTAILSDEERAQFRAILGYALAASLEQEAKVAAAGLEDARLFLETQAEKRARLNYLLGATGGAALAVALGAIGLSAWPHDAPAEPTVFHLACIALIGGALGGMLSIGRRQRGPTRFDPLASAEACRISGALRVLYAAISGFLVYAAIHVGLVTSAFVENLSSSAEQIAAGILISAAGGYLENWTTSILGLVGGNQDRGSQNAGADAQPGEDSA